MQRSDCPKEWIPKSPVWLQFRLDTCFWVLNIGTGPIVAVWVVLIGDMIIISFGDGV